jgi:hypothetical protein
MNKNRIFQGKMDAWISALSLVFGIFLIFAWSVGWSPVWLFIAGWVIRSALPNSTWE